MMNQMKKSVLALVVMAASGHAMAADSVDVKVIGTITPAACTPTLSGGGTVDYGNIKALSLDAANYTKLDVKTIDLAINCDAPTKVALTAINGRPNTMAGAVETDAGATPPVSLIANNGVGLGMADSAKIGGYVIAYGAPVADGVAVSTLYAAVNSSTWNYASVTSAYGHGTPLNMSWGDSKTKTPVAFTTLSVPLNIQAYINKASELDLTKPIQLNGLTTLEMVYL